MNDVETGLVVRVDVGQLGFGKLVLVITLELPASSLMAVGDRVNVAAATVPLRPLVSNWM